MSFEEIIPNINVVYIFLLLCTFCIFESDQVDQPNVGAPENEPSKILITGLKRFERNISLTEDKSYVSIINLKMIPLLFRRFPHAALTLTKEEWRPENCELNKYWSILLIFDRRQDVKPFDTAKLTMILDDVFRIFKNISRVKYDVSNAIFDRESVKIMLCFQNVPETGNHNTQSEQEYVEKLIKDELLPIFETFYPSYKTETNIAPVKHELDGACSTIIFDVSFEVHWKKFSIELMNFIDRWLKKIPGWYTNIMAACLLGNSETTSKNTFTYFTKIRLKVNKLNNYCKVLNSGNNGLCSPYKKEILHGGKDLVEKLVREEISPIFETFYSSYKTEFKIIPKGDEVVNFCSMQVFEISLEIYDTFYKGALVKFVENRLQKLPEMYDYIMAACLLKRSDTANYYMITRYSYLIRLKLFKPGDNCGVSKGRKNIKCL